MDNWLFPPRLFDDPPEGWSTWGMRPAVAQAKALLDALGGRLQGPAAEKVRAQFHAGRPLVLLPWPYDLAHGEWFRFAPLLWRLEAGRYAVGSSRQEFKAPSDEEALFAAQRWFLRSREDEISRARAAAQKALNSSRAEAPLYTRLLERVLEHIGQLRDAAGKPCVWSEGIHGWWLAECRDTGAELARWRYSVRGENATMVGFFLLALRERQECAATVSPEEAEALLGPAGWQRQDGRCSWKRGALRGNVIYIDDERAGILSLRELGNNVVEVSVQGPQGPILESIQVRVPSVDVARAWAIGETVERVVEAKGRLPRAVTASY